MKRAPSGFSTRGSQLVVNAGYSLFFAVESAFALVARWALRFDLEAVLDFAVVDFADEAFADFLVMAVLSAFFACCWAACACSLGAATSINAAAAAAMVRRFIWRSSEGG